ncbi:ribosomal protein L6, alpha-beta domain-containing protein [Zychaea mexicana]|uniref:ribosomal protein L6, alpha-beta domain-containing protein n=1 Tax=Zychaea mexicana TaxID=64656 RepID=UPI0022FDE634|nr:ribosomal protein L6, alpha-beta domain-containing protein [Zychaea mexicana]KAI9494326.1 ribosomal protein L6, alpha-beta domain-containing protein [Zychaea mexicana]
MVLTPLRHSVRFVALRQTTITLTRSFHAAAPAASHIGRKAISFSDDVKIEHDLTPISTPRIPSELNNTTLTVTGPLGQQKLVIKPFVNVATKAASPDDPNSQNRVEVSVQDPEIKQQRAMWGTTRALISNAITGVSDGYRVMLRLNGVGYRGVLENNDRSLSLKLGYSHPVIMDLPQGVTCAIPQPNRLILQGTDLQIVTEFAAKIQRWRKPEPYNQKGIFINDETIKKKEGKKK